MLEKPQLFNDCGPLTYYLLKGLLKILWQPQDQENNSTLIIKIYSNIIVHEHLFPKELVEVAGESRV